MFTKMKYASAVEVVSLSAWLKRLLSERVAFSSFNVFRFCEYIQVASAGPRRGLDYLARGRAGEAARQRFLFRSIPAFPGAHPGCRPLPSQAFPRLSPPAGPPALQPAHRPARSVSLWAGLAS